MSRAVTVEEALALLYVAPPKPESDDERERVPHVYHAGPMGDWPEPVTEIEAVLRRARPESIQVGAGSRYSRAVFYTTGPDSSGRVWHGAFCAQRCERAKIFRAALAIVEGADAAPYLDGDAYEVIVVKLITGTNGRWFARVGHRRIEDLASADGGSVQDVLEQLAAAFRVALAVLEGR